MPVRIPTTGELPEGVAMLPDVLGGNVRAYRQLRNQEQEQLAGAMQLFGHQWRRATVSEVERGRRNVTVSELLALVFILRVPVQLLLDPRGPVGSFGQLALSISVDPRSEDGWIGIEGKDLPALLCLHKPAGAEAGPKIDQIEFIGRLPGLKEHTEPSS